VLGRKDSFGSELKIKWFCFMHFIPKSINTRGMAIPLSLQLAQQRGHGSGNAADFTKKFILKNFNQRQYYITLGYFLVQ
jgi:hypothetical protein